MKEHIKIVSYKEPLFFLNETLTIYFKNDDKDPVWWFKVIGSGQESEGKMYIEGYDKERMNKKIYIDDIEYVMKTR